MGLSSKLKQQAMGFSAKAMERLLSNEGRAAKVAQAFGAVQQGRAALTKSQQAVLHQFAFATKGDFKALGKQLSVMRRRAKAALERLG